MQRLNYSHFCLYFLPDAWHQTPLLDSTPKLSLQLLGSFFRFLGDVSLLSVAHLWHDVSLQMWRPLYYYGAGERIAWLRMFAALLGDSRWVKTHWVSHSYCNFRSRGYNTIFLHIHTIVADTFFLTHTDYIFTFFLGQMVLFVNLTKSYQIGAKSQLLLMVKHSQKLAYWRNVPNMQSSHRNGTIKKICITLWLLFCYKNT